MVRRAYRRRRIIRRRPRPYRRTRFRRRGRRGGRTTVQRAKGVITSDAAFVKLRYTKETYALIGSGGTATEAAMAANNLFDPDPAIGGRQPTGFDQYCPGLYQRWTVYASKIQATVINQGLTSNDQVRASVFPNFNTAGTPSTDQITEIPYVRSKYVGIANSGQAIRTISHFMTTRKMWGIKTLDPVNWSGSETSGPGFNWFWFLYIHRVPGPEAATEIPLGINIRMTYYVKFWGRNVRQGPS